MLLDEDEIIVVEETPRLEVRVGVVQRGSFFRGWDLGRTEVSVIKQYYSTYTACAEVCDGRGCDEYLARI